ncbi:MAG TPA: 4'-phosphopantetheinyl transferase superfamily protein [Azospirillaceae bacterium]|nr:4'-phosphopantetheinyl transferase superfamily protein [Azospirillaceae bacterium]
MTAPPGPTEIHLWPFTLDVGAAMAVECRQWLAHDEMARARRFARADLQRRFVVARGRLRAILARYLGADPADLAFAQEEAGKPFLAGGGDLRFNLSHTGDHAVVAVAWGREVGVDIETRQRFDDLDGLAALVLGSDERQALAAHDAADRSLAFLVAWTRKEALLKATGHGLTVDPTRVTVGFDDAPRTVTLPPASGSWTVTGFAAGMGLVGAVACAGPAATVIHRRHAVFVPSRLSA